jgi:hypothetical protein
MYNQSINRRHPNVKRQTSDVDILPGATGGTPPVRVILSEGTGRVRPVAPSGGR